MKTNLNYVLILPEEVIDSKNGEGLEKKLLHKKYVDNMG